jgi:hypothetical protein
MPFSGTQQLLRILLLVNVALASRFSFAIQEIDVRETLGLTEDTLVLALASTTGYGTLNKTWSLGVVKQNSTIKWNNLTQEVEVPASASNLSIALGVFNHPNRDDSNESVTGK